MSSDEGVVTGMQVFTPPSASHHPLAIRLHRRRRARPSVRRIEIHEDVQYRWWWALYDDGSVTVHGPYDTKRDAKNDAHTDAPHVHVATIPWKLP